MKYWIDGVQQEILLRLNLKAHDAVILRYLRDLFANPENIHAKKFTISKTEKSKAFYHVSKSALLDNLPILHWKKDTLNRRFQLYVKKGILTKKESKLYSSDPNEPFKRILYFRFNPPAEQALFSSPKKIVPKPPTF